MSINRVVVSGNLTRDPELRATPGGTQVLGFGVAVNDRRRNQQTGEWEDYPNFIDCTMFGNRAEALSRILRKGMKVAIEGKLRYSSWEDKNGGGRRSKVEIIPDEVVLMSQNPNGQQAPQQYAPQGYQQQYAPQQAPRAYAPQPASQQPAPQWNAQQAYQQAPQAAPQPAPQQAAPQPAPAQQQLDVYDEDIPF
ncbi:single-stranded DNA-binding protein [Collinsella aerofaciens]|uniref:single-stranded DNA-binding protein n=1 Tax=Collinsella aerofaciens TaxID=74426 RepID=UPI00232AEF2B|nr:single-stranded DNA-binding protein [Collinsella aerofaciens]MDB1879348.1 single-stranded DNA-binding protein [Collinsella aerofaciens]MDB1881540.1 single-stranded DNA-binding protein [Collinsella aerofaciens]MDB1883353.1 single-stranded DNA-binding protein [Collinsella aerofaciens]MDB1886926.1 single-stranded DNA-binding protein [Collinsella aerofaciens]